MTADGPTAPAGPRKPRVFLPDDPALKRIDTEFNAAPEPGMAGADADAAAAGVARSQRVSRAKLVDTGFRWGALLGSAIAGALLLSLTLWFWRVVSIGFERDDAIGWAIRIFVGIAALAAAALLLREIAGFFRLGRLARLKSDAAKAIAARDLKLERATADRLLHLYGQMPERKWAVDRVRAHAGDVLDAGERLTLVEREVLAGVDQDARMLITTSAKRVATVTAMMPLMSFAFLFLIFETLRMLRQVATQYGGRPGFAGSLRLARTVVGNLIAAGGVALTDDLLGQFLGQDMLRRLSRRLGEGVFNGALVARIGVASLDVIRPLPFRAADSVRVRDIVAAAFRRRDTSADTADKTNSTP